MDDLVAFLRARLDEDEEVARLADAVDPAPWHEDVGEGTYTNQRDGIDGVGLVRAADNVGLWDREQSGTLSMAAVTAIHIARHDPGAALREIEAKRRLVGNHVADDKGHCRTCAHWKSDWIDGFKVERLSYEGVRSPCLTLRLMALPYAGHPEYRQEWTP